jgi:hypothetical protein
MSQISHFKVLYYVRLCERWCSIDLTIGGWCDSWWCRYLICQENDLVSHRNIGIKDKCD